MLPLFFLYGFLAACAGLLLQILLLTGSSTANVLQPSFFFLIVAALIEESVKLGFLFQAMRRFGSQTFQLRSLVLFGVGFALLEIAFAFFSNSTGHPPTLLLIANGLLHILTVILLGLALKKFPRTSAAFWGTFLSTICLHILYNLARLNTP